MLDEIALRWLNTLRLSRRLKAKCVPLAVRKLLVEERFARVTGSNLVITSAGLNGSPRHPQERFASYIYLH
jgi:hypothetical protein